MADNDVTNYEFEDLRLKIQEKLRSKEGWGDAYESTVGQTLIDINADAADILSYMLERRSQESFQTTARLRSSVVTKSSENGYRSRRAIASTGFLEIKLVDENGDPKPVADTGLVEIPEGTPITFDGENFFTQGGYEVTAGETTARIGITQGVRETITIDPNQDTNFLEGRFILIPDYEYIDEDSLVVVSNNVEYRDIKILHNLEGIGIGALSFSEELGSDPESGAYYDVRYAHNGMRIQFGDGVFGRVPDRNITISYVRTKGEQVRVLSLDNEFSFDFDTFGDGINVTPRNEYEYELKNVSQIIGGRPPESIEDIRVSAPLSLTTNNRAVSLAGYGYWARRSNIGGIIDAKAYAEAELDTLIYNMNNVYISYLTETGAELIPEQKQQLIDFIKERDVALAHIVPVPAQEIQLGLDIVLKKNRRLQISPNDLHVIVRDYLNNYYRRQYGSIGKEYQKSDLICDIHELTTRVSGVDYTVVDFVNIDISAYQEETFPGNVSDAVVRLRATTNDVSVGDTFTLTIDGQDYTVTAENADFQDAGQVYVNLLQKMRDKLFIETNLVPRVYLVSDASGTEYVLELGTRDNLGGFTITVENGSLSQYTILNYKLQIHRKTFDNESEDIILRGSLQLIDSDKNVLYHDNGDGYWVDTSNGDLVSLNPVGGGSGSGDAASSEMIDYTNGVLTLPVIPEGTYYVKYKQDEFENFVSNGGAAVTLIPPKEEFDDEEETFTKIKLLTV